MAVHTEEVTAVPTQGRFVAVSEANRQFSNALDGLLPADDVADYATGLREGDTASDVKNTHLLSGSTPPPLTTFVLWVNLRSSHQMFSSMVSVLRNLRTQYGAVADIAALRSDDYGVTATLAISLGSQDSVIADHEHQELPSVRGYLLLRSLFTELKDCHPHFSPELPTLHSRQMIDAVRLRHQEAATAIDALLVEADERSGSHQYN